MRVLQRLFGMCIFLSLGACVPYSLQPLTANHPANPDAASAAPLPVSRTLTYAAAALPPGAVSQAAAEPNAHDVHHAPAPAAEKTAVGEGTVVAVVPGSGQLVVQHGAIKDFMDAMTMGYPIEPVSLLEGLKPGDKVRFAIDVKRKVIVKIEKMN